MLLVVFFFFQAEDGIRDLVRSRGLGDVYKRQAVQDGEWLVYQQAAFNTPDKGAEEMMVVRDYWGLSLIHI